MKRLIMVLIFLCAVNLQAQIDTIYTEYTDIEISKEIRDIVRQIEEKERWIEHYSEWIEKLDDAYAVWVFAHIEFLTSKTNEKFEIDRDTVIKFLKFKRDTHIRERGELNVKFWQLVSEVRDK